MVHARSCFQMSLVFLSVLVVVLVASLRSSIKERWAHSCQCQVNGFRHGLFKKRKGTLLRWMSYNHNFVYCCTFCIYMYSCTCIEKASTGKTGLENMFAERVCSLSEYTCLHNWKHSLIIVSLGENFAKRVSKNKEYMKQCCSLIWKPILPASCSGWRAMFGIPHTGTCLCSSSL